MKNLIKTATGDKNAYLVLKNGKVFNAFTAEFEKQDIAIYKDRIAGIGKNYKGNIEIDLKGKIVVPGFIDAHVHIESSMLVPQEFAKAALLGGTTTVIADPHEIANVLGYDGVLYMLDASRDAVIDIFYTVPSCVPESRFVTAGGRIDSKDIEKLLSKEKVIGIGEVMDFSGILNTSPHILSKIEKAKKEIIDGHAPKLKGKYLNAYISAGIYSDHECTSSKEALEKLKRGMWIMIREGTGAKNLTSLVSIINNLNHTRMMFVSDDKHPDELINGYMNLIVSKAIENNISLEIALRMVTLNPSIYFNLKGYGAIAPGFFADISIFEDQNFSNKPWMVIKKGKIVVKEGKLIKRFGRAFIPENVKNTVKIPKIDENSFKFHHKGRVRAIKILKGQILTEEIIEKPENLDKLIVIERHGKKGNIAKGYVKGFEIKKGAFGSTVAHDSHNLIIVGKEEKDMYLVAKKLEEIGGGIAVSINQEIKGVLPLPVAGLMSDRSIETVVKEFKEILKKVKETGTPIENPFFVLSFLSLSVIPSLRITDKGVFDSKNMKFVSVEYE